ncbi:hypothetical protein F3Y22_tig00111064pilonHSYRG00039 [Hibiscus syriacus]|uniref:Reverse transcriptase Ty1/copia-type domain-containing protein n=1 Tax=Hibiscus syriacus TaxID=106335 RepID=A0A6A2Z496_HIBSY|nr:hypothetical protein F3Y22_tig00111064pilonHSYRG00039 [Hibiscus syriacus]
MVSNSNKINLWPARLEHVPATQLNRLPMFHSISININSVHDCSICPLVRQSRLPFPSFKKKRLPFPISTSRAESPFALIHLDLWGPYRISTHSGQRYFLTIVDSSWLQNYTCTCQSSLSTGQSSSLSYSHLSLPTQVFLTYISNVSEPRSYSEAVKDPHWVQAMSEEIQALESNNMWIVESLPSGKIAIGCKWVYRIKYRASGEVERYKTRLVAKGYNQEERIDYVDTFSPIAKMSLFEFWP